jgi:hypothetical protein
MIRNGFVGMRGECHRNIETNEDFFSSPRLGYQKVLCVFLGALLSYTKPKLAEHMRLCLKRA